MDMDMDVPGRAPNHNRQRLALLDTLTPLAQRWRSLVLVTVIAGGIGAGYAFSIKPVFTATTSCLPPQQQSGASVALASLSALTGSPSAASKNSSDQYITLMRSEVVSDRIIDRFKLLTIYETPFLDRAREVLLRNTQMSVGKKDGMIFVSVDDTDPVRAAAMANQFIEELRNLTNTLAISEAQRRRVFFEKQMLDTKASLTAAQIALQGSGFTSGALRAEPATAAGAYARVRADLAAAEVKLLTLRSSLSENAPEVRQQTTLIQALRQQLQAEGSSDPDAAGGPKNADYIGKFREFKYQEALFDGMARQYELARVDESREGALIQVVDVAKPPLHKSRPKRLNVALTFTAAGAILYAALIVMRAKFDAALADPGAAARWKRFREAFRRS